MVKDILKRLASFRASRKKRTDDILVEEIVILSIIDGARIVSKVLVRKNAISPAFHARFLDFLLRILDCIEKLYSNGKELNDGSEYFDYILPWSVDRSSN